VISQTSVASETCKLEIAHAVKNNKRLIPVVIDNVEPQRVTPELAILNWLLFRSGDEFSRAFQDLIDAIQTDYSWVKEHTRLQMRALEWTRKDREKGSLLRGRSLGEAEAWLAQAADKTPRPTSLHTEYLLASRRAANRRWRLAAAGGLTSILLVLAASLTMVVLQTNARRQAEAALQAARSRQLAAASTQQLHSDPSLSLLLGLEAMGMEDTIEARSSLLAALNRSAGVEAFLHGQDTGVSSLAFSPEGDLLATGSCLEDIYLGGGSAPCLRAGLMLWDARAHTLLETIETGLQDARVMSFSPDGRLLAIGGAFDRAGMFMSSCQGAVELWDVAGRQRVGSLLGPRLEREGSDIQVEQLAFSPDGRWLATAEETSLEDATIRLWDLESQEMVWSVSFDWWITGLAFSPDGAWLAATSAGGDAVGLWPAAGGRPGPMAERWEIESPMGLAFHPGGEVLAVSHDDGSIALMDPSSGEVLREQSGGGSGKGGPLHFSPDGRYLVTGSGENRVVVWEVASAEEGYRAGYPFELEAATLPAVPVTQAAFSHGGYRLATGSEDGSVIIWDLGRSHPLATAEFPSVVPSLGLAFSPDGAVLAATGDRVRLWDLRSGDQISQLPPQRWDWPETALAFSPDGKTLIIGDENFTENVTLWDLEGDRPIAVGLEGHEAAVSSVAFSPTGEVAASGSLDGTIILWDPRAGAALGPPLTYEPDAPDLVWLGGAGTHAVLSIAFTPDGRWLVSGLRGGEVLIWDIAQQQPQRPAWLAHRGAVEAVAVSPDGRTLASGGSDGLIRLWDLETGVPAGELPGHAGPVSGLAFSPDGALLASREGFGGVLRLWDVTATRPLGEAMPAMADNVYSIAFGPNGLTLASGGDRLITWDLSTTSWLEQARRIANRDLTMDERELYGIP
jgi:WD40 repeat protein